MSDIPVFDFELVYEQDSGTYMITLPDRGRGVVEPAVARFENNMLVVTFADNQTLPLGPFDDKALRDLAMQERLLIVEVADDGDIARAYYTPIKL
jgi:hypothetical protein